MNIIDLQLFVNTVFYFGIVICGFVISIPIGVTNINNGGQCLLYADFTYKNASYGTINYSSKGNCNFPIYLGVFADIFFALGVGIYSAYAVFKSSKDKTIASQMWVMPFILVDALVAAASFVASCMVSVGFNQVCNHLTKKYEPSGTRLFSSCVKVQNKNVINTTNGKVHNTGNFYAHYTVAQLAGWICFLLWAALVVSNIVRAVRNRKMRGAGTDATTSDKTNIGNVEPTA
ncbi:hypothetical protein FSP39_018024 [Pinctada imbricata]|uniref:MARVEL domain-containing protein n=1 Tax=Pinctada imbricata TaxID=66713 RepID=A0AA88Y3W8_PINIB|nr:hypothetical protein FSP39_018024 [Pinctada imbricata]